MGNDPSRTAVASHDGRKTRINIDSSYAEEYKVRLCSTLVYACVRRAPNCSVRILRRRRHDEALYENRSLFTLLLVLPVCFRKSPGTFPLLHASVIILHVVSYTDDSLNRTVVVLAVGLGRDGIQKTSLDSITHCRANLEAAFGAEKMALVPDQFSQVRGIPNRACTHAPTRA